MATTILQPIDDFLRRAELSDSPLEYDRGEVREMSRPSAEHQALAALIILALGPLLKRANARISLGHGLVLADDVARIPDLYVARSSTYEAMKRRPANYYVGYPELIIEIVSPSDLAYDIDLKVRQYLTAGAKSVWSVYYGSRHVLVHREDTVATNYEESDTIVETIFDKKLSLPVAEIFADLS